MNHSAQAPPPGSGAGSAANVSSAGSPAARAYICGFDILVLRFVSMIFPRALNRAVGLLLIGALLHAQLAVTAYTCPDISRAVAALKHATRSQSAARGSAPARTGITVAAGAAMDAVMPEMAVGMSTRCAPAKMGVPNLCLEHCTYGYQSADTPAASLVHSGPPVLLYRVPGILEADRSVGRFPRSDTRLAATPPPHSILHCVFLI